ncbi:MAG: redoxin domain-containing protein, partial [Prevotella sp.]|nr:redoxin domain-containing protein [Prevotella sp.]
MKKKILFFIAILTFQVASAQENVQPDANGYIVYEGEKAPDFETTLTNGQRVRLSDLRGKLVMLQ